MIFKKQKLKIPAILHVILWLLLPVQVILFKITGGLTIRYDVFHQLWVILIFFTGFWLFFTARRHVGVLKRIYLWLYPVYTGLLIFAFAVDRMFFVICMIPLWFFVLPQSTHISNGKYTLKSNKTVLGHEEVELYRNYAIFQKYIGNIADIEPSQINKWEQLKILDSAGKEHSIILRINQTDTIFPIRYPN